MDVFDVLKNDFVTIQYLNKYCFIHLFLEPLWTSFLTWQFMEAQNLVTCFLINVLLLVHESTE